MEYYNLTIQNIKEQYKQSDFTIAYTFLLFNLITLTKRAIVDETITQWLQNASLKKILVVLWLTF